MNNNELGGNNSKLSRINSEPSSAHPPEDEYRVGYRRPPLNTRFKPGRSGNPKGRPKGSKSLQRLLKEALDEPVIVQEGGQRRTITKRQAMAKQVVNKAATGDLRALKYLSEIMNSAEWKTENPSRAELESNGVRDRVTRMMDKLRARFEEEDRMRDKKSSET